MPVGNQATEASINQALTSYSTQLRDICQNIENLQQFLNGAAGLGLAGLEALGYSQADAQVVLSMANYMNTVAGCYFGTVQQGGSGGTGAILFNFGTALSPLWAAQ